MKNNIKGKVLFIYPNCEGDGGIPNGMALLSGCLKEAGFERKCFDTSFLKSAPVTHFYRKKHGGMMDANHVDYWGEWNSEIAEKIPQMLIKTIDNYKPDLIAIYLIDVSYVYGISLLKVIKEKFDIPVIAGGPIVTHEPEMTIKNDCVDAACIGEGENAIVEFSNCVIEKKSYEQVKNLCIKKNGKIIKNPLRPLKELDELPFQDWSIFDPRHYYKPYCGKFMRTGFFELARGCHFNCTFCATASLRKLYHGLGKFVRTRSVDKTFDEITYIKDKYNLELVFFIDDNFLGMPEERFDYFCKEYKRRINLPFYIQTRSETVIEDRIKRLKEIGISTIGVGIEHGDEEYRRKHLNRNMSNENLKKVFEIIHKYDIRSTANVVLGMPHEKESMMKKTIDLLKEIKPRSISVNYFQPYRGTAMRETAIELGTLPKDHLISNSNDCLDLPEFQKERVIHYYENLIKYVDGDLEFEKSIS